MQNVNKYYSSSNDIIRPDKTVHTKRLVISAITIVTATAIVTRELSKNVEEKLRKY